jgi:hypothetical protein
MARAVLPGSSGSAGGGVRAVLTAQKRQPRVQVSPSSITVAVPISPFQHCARRGDAARQRAAGARGAPAAAR